MVKITIPLGRRGGGLLGVIFARYVPLTSQNPYPIIVYSVLNYKPHLSHFWTNVIFRDPSLRTFYLYIYLINPLMNGPNFLD